LGNPRIKAVNALSYLFLNVWLHADKQLPRKDQALIACEHQRISGNSIKCGEHGLILINPACFVEFQMSHSKCILPMSERRWRPSKVILVLSL
jgi:hypothetical protein